MQERFPCPVCGNTITTGQAVCPQCGITLKYHCTHCGNAVEPYFRFCTHCGVPLFWNEKPVAGSGEGEKPHHPAALYSILDRITDEEARSRAAALIDDLVKEQGAVLSFVPVQWCIAIKTAGGEAAYLWPLENHFALSYRSEKGTWLKMEVTDDASYKAAFTAVSQAITISSSKAL